MQMTGQKHLKLKHGIGWEGVKEDLKQIRWKDPIVIVLCTILVFLTFGSAMGVATGVSKNAVKVEIDAAYGGTDTGYEGIVNEADVTENIVNELEKLLKNDRRFKVYRTHAAGTALSVAERAAKIKKDDPMVVVSVHADGSPNIDLSGMHVYAEVPGNANHEASLNLANCISKAFTSETWPAYTGYLYYQPTDTENQYELKYVPASDTADYHMDTFELMKQCDMPVVVTSQFYVTNQSDVDQWASSDGYYKAAVDLYDALCEYNGFEPLTARNS
jgi:N-acetylmuramoyl-L-alanine amidase